MIDLRGGGDITTNNGFQQKATAIELHDGTQAGSNNNDI